MPDPTTGDSPELSAIGSELSSAPKNGAGAAAYKAEVDAYEHASANDPDQIFEKKLRLAFHKRELKQIDELIAARTTYANKIYDLVVRWLIAIGVVLLLQGFSMFHFGLPEKVLLALVGGTTLNVIGIFTIVANFLFPKGASALMMKMKSMRKAREKEVAPATRRRSAKGQAPSTNDSPTSTVGSDPAV